MRGGPINDPNDLAEATRVINLYASDDRTTIRYTQHAQDRCSERALSPIWIQDVLKYGVAVEVRCEQLHGKRIYKYKVEYTDRYGVTAVVTVVNVPYKLTIVTVMRDD